jgi:hypothetical protein
MSKEVCHDSTCAWQKWVIGREVNFKSIFSSLRVSSLLRYMPARFSRTKSVGESVRVHLEPKWQGRVALIISLITLGALVYYAHYTQRLWSEAQMQTQLIRRTNRAYVYLVPRSEQLIGEIVPLGWPLKLEVINLGVHPAYDVRVSWKLDSDSTLAFPRAKPSNVGVVFRGQPLTASGFIPIDSTGYYSRTRQVRFLHAVATYKDIEEIKHYYVGLFSVEVPIGTGDLDILLIIADSDKR